MSFHKLLGCLLWQKEAGLLEALPNTLNIISHWKCVSCKRMDVLGKIPWNVITSAKIVYFFRQNKNSNLYSLYWGTGPINFYMQDMPHCLIHTCSWIPKEMQCGDQEFVCLKAHWKKKWKSDGPSLLYHSINLLYNFREASESINACSCLTISNVWMQNE